VADLKLRYHHVNQSEPWQKKEMKPVANGFRATIPVAYTDSPFPLQHHCIWKLNLPEHQAQAKIERTKFMRVSKFGDFKLQRHLSY
jgi:hypothetical protein